MEIVKARYVECTMCRTINTVWYSWMFRCRVCSNGFCREVDTDTNSGLDTGKIIILAERAKGYKLWKY